MARSLASLCLDHGGGYLPGPFAWSPGWIELYLLDHLPRKVAFDSAQRTALPDVLRAWLRFAFAKQGIAPEWVPPVLATVDTHVSEFLAAFDDECSEPWGECLWR